METVKKALKGIFICLLSIILMSHNTYALTLTQNVKLMAVYSAGMSAYSSVISVTDAAYVYGGSTGIWVDDFYITFRNLVCEPNDLLQVNLNVFQVNNNDALNAWVSSLYGGDNDFSFIETEYQSLDQNTGQIKITLSCTSNVNRAYSYIRLDSAINQRLALNSNEYISTLYVSRYKINDPSIDAHEAAENLYEINQKLDDMITELGSNSQALDTINDNVDDVNQTLQDHYEQENQAYDNISNQDASDLQGDTDNQASTNLIGLFQSFITALSNVTQANNCNLQLNFPSYAGGTITVNVCQYKDKGGNIVAIFSSLTLIVFYIPLALKLLSMIYNEIRSFTNG